MQEIVEEVFDLVKKHFRPKRDVEEFWTSHAAEVMQKEDFFDDCDGFALTCAELLIFKDVPRELVSIVHCQVGTMGHLVCGVQTPETTLILDNLRPRIYDWRNSAYIWLAFMTFDKPGEWYRVSNFDEEENS